MGDRRSHRQHRDQADREDPAEPAAPAHPVRATQRSDPVGAGRIGHRVHRTARGAVDRQGHRLPERAEDRLQPADHRRRPGEPHRWLLSGRAGLGFGDALADQLPGRREDPVLRRDRFHRRRDHRAVVRAATALHAPGRAGGTAADHCRTTDRHQAVELRDQGVPLRRGAGDHHRARRRLRRPGHRGAARRCPVDPAVRAAGGQTQGTGIGGRARTGGPRAGAG